MLTEEEFREELHRRVGAGLDQVLAAPTWADGVRARQARRTVLVRSGAAATSVAAVVGLVVGAAAWSGGGSPRPAPSAPAASAAVSSTSSTAAPAPDPSTAVIDMSRVAPLVTSGPCKGLQVGVYQDLGVAHPPVTALTPAGLVLTIGGGGLLRFHTGGPCVDRLVYVQRTATFGNGVNVPTAFHQDEAGLVTEGSPQNQTGVVQFFLDCKGLVCSQSGSPLATITVHLPGTAPGASAAGFEPVPTPIPLPVGETVTVPSVVGLTPDAARQKLEAAGAQDMSGGYGDGSGGTVAWQDPPAGSVVLKGNGVSLYITGGRPFTPPAAPVGQPSAAPQSAQPSAPAQPSLPGTGNEVPFIHWPQRGELVNSRAALDAEAAWDAAKNPHHDMRIVYAGSFDGMQGVIVEGELRMALLVRPSPDAPFTVLDDRFVRQNGGLRELSAMGRPMLKGGKPASYQVAFAVVHPGDVVSVRSPGLQADKARSYVAIVRLPLSATRSSTTLDVTGGSTTVNVPIDPPSSS